MDKPIEHLSLCEPFKRLTPDTVDALLANADIRTINAGDSIVEKQRNFAIFQYLVKGTAEIRKSFFEREEFTQDDPRALKALEQLSEPGVPITAHTDCVVAKFFKTEVEAAVNGNTSAIQTKKAKPKNDWMELFLLSPLVSHLDANGIAELLASVQDVPVKKGQLVIKPGVPGDCFYVIKEGTALVKPMGSTDKTIFKLEAGAQFGEEALVAETVRNAKIVMATDGTLGRINKAFFNSVIKNAVIKRAKPADIEAMKAQGAEISLLDVRLYPEFNVGHREDAVNMPVSKLRANFGKLDRNSTYLITPEGAKRSELATFLLRQAGFNAMLIDEAC